jgi:hypothetical protein
LIFYIEGVVLKRLFLTTSLLVSLLLLSVISFASEEYGNIYDTYYLDTEAVEDIIFEEYDGEYAEEMRDILIDGSTLEFDGIRYIEYDVVRENAIRSYGEDVADQITGHPGLRILSKDYIFAKHNTEESVSESLEVQLEEEEKKLKELETGKKNHSTLLYIIDLIIGNLILIAVFIFIEAVYDKIKHKIIKIKEKSGKG